MIRIKLDTSKFKISEIKITKLELFTVAKIMVDRYFKRMKRGQGINEAGTLVPHAPLSPNYKIRPSGQPAKPPPLIDTGFMAGSLKAIWGESTAKRAVIRVLSRTLTRRKLRAFQKARKIKTKRKFRPTKLKTDDLAAIHHFGSTKMNIPARPHIGFSKADKKEAVKQFSKLLKKEIKRMQR